MSGKDDGQEFDDGEYDGEIAGHKTVETIETKMGADGVEETHISHEVKRADKCKFTFSSKEKKNYKQIDWTK